MSETLTSSCGGPEPDRRLDSRATIASSGDAATSFSPDGTVALPLLRKNTFVQ
jgi:hypothetical protein